MTNDDTPKNVVRIGDYIPKYQNPTLSIPLSGNGFLRRDVLFFRLAEANCYYLGDIIRYSEDELKKNFRFTDLDLSHLKSAISDTGLSLGTKPIGWKPPSQTLFL